MKLNGKPLDASAAPGSYLTLNRAWKAGDRIEMELPMHLHVEAMPDDPHMQAFLYGPLVLAGDLGNEGLTEAHIFGPNLRVGAADRRAARTRRSDRQPDAAHRGRRDPDVPGGGGPTRVRGSSRRTSPDVSGRSGRGRT